jgi:hypothetical protein
MPVAALLAPCRAADLRCGLGAGLGKKPAVVCAEIETKDPDLQDVFYGSDGTRTRDLRRDSSVRLGTEVVSNGRNGMVTAVE